MSGIHLLLMAAKMLDKPDKDTDHGYACPVRPHSKSFSSSREFPAHHRRRKFKRTLSVSGSFQRSSHNELEKSRRAHMRCCFEELKKVVPLDGSSSKHTTQGLLKSARQLIVSLRSRVEAARASRLQERQRTAMLQERLAQLKLMSGSSPGGLQLTISSDNSSRSSCRSYSESSGVSSISVSPTSETEQVDVVGLGSTPTVDGYFTNLNSYVTKSSSRKKGLIVKSLADGVYLCSTRMRGASSSPSDMDDSRSLASVDSGCGLSPVSKIAIDGL